MDLAPALAMNVGEICTRSVVVIEKDEENFIGLRKTIDQCRKGSPNISQRHRHIILW
jgi:hypothetical protein